MSMAGLNSLRPGSVAQLTDTSGRELSTLPSELARQLLAVDQILRDYGMTFNIVCEECVQRLAPLNL